MQTKFKQEFMARKINNNVLETNIKLTALFVPSTSRTPLYNQYKKPSFVLLPSAREQSKKAVLQRT